MYIPAQQINSLRNIDLHEVFERVGYDWDRKKDDEHQFRTEKGRISVTGPKFHNQDTGEGNGGAISLVMYLLDLEFIAAVKWLADEFASGIAHQQAPIVHIPNKKPLVLPERYDAGIGSVFAYLAGRGISALTIQQLIAEGTLYAAKNRGFLNAVFLATDDAGLPVGAEIKGTRGDFSKLASGSSRNEGYFRIERGSSAVAITESAIDAISFFELYQIDAISTSGARPDAPYIPALLNRYEHVYCAYDADHEGHRTSEAMIAKYPRIQRLLPTSVPRDREKWDWNDAVKNAHELMAQFFPR